MKLYDNKDQSITHSTLGTPIIRELLRAVPGDTHTVNPYNCNSEALKITAHLRPDLSQYTYQILGYGTIKNLTDFNKEMKIIFTFESDYLNIESEQYKIKMIRPDNHLDRTKHKDIVMSEKAFKGSKPLSLLKYRENLEKQKKKFHKYVQEDILNSSFDRYRYFFIYREVFQLRSTLQLQKCTNVAELLTLFQEVQKFLTTIVDQAEERERHIGKRLFEDSHEPLRQLYKIKYKIRDSVPPTESYRQQIVENIETYLLFKEKENEKKSTISIEEEAEDRDNNQILDSRTQLMAADQDTSEISEVCNSSPTKDHSGILNTTKTVVESGFNQNPALFESVVNKTDVEDNRRVPAVT